MKPWNQSVSMALPLLVLLVGPGVGFYGCSSLRTDGGFAESKATMLLDSDIKTISNPLTRPQETPTFLMPGQRRPAAMLLDLDADGKIGEKSTPMPIKEQAPATMR